MIRYFILHPTAANLLMGLLIILGLITLPTLKRETFPEIKRYEIEVKILYPGATPREIEQKICKPIEDTIDGTSFIDEIRCESRQSLAIATIKMQEHGDFDQFNNDIRSAIDEVENFPDDSEEPIIRELGRTQDVVTIALSANIPKPELKDLAESIKERILRVPGIPLVSIEGFSKRQFQIQLAQDKLRQYGISLQSVATTLAQQNLDLPTGEIQTSKRDYQIRFNDERRSPEQLKDLVIISGEHGNEVRLGDIATIIDNFEKAEDKATYNNLPTAFLKIRKNSQDDSLRILEQVKIFIKQEQQALPEQVHFNLTQDFTSIVEDRIALLISNAWQGLLLVFGVMWLFFGTRYAFWVVMGLPVSFLASAFLLAQWGISINMLSMVALLLALGILMDDAIVISESIGKHISLGKSPIQAAIDGTMEVKNGVLSSYVTTLCIFTGLLFLNGEIGQLLYTIPAVLISVISISLLEAFLILPHHLQHSLQNNSEQTISKVRQQFSLYFGKLHLKVNGWVKKLIVYRYLFMGSVVGVFILSVSLLVSGIVKFSAFPNVEGDLLQARLLMPVGSSLAQTQQTIDKITSSIQIVNKNYQQNYQTPLVLGMTVHYGMNADAFERGAHLATVSVDLLTAEQRQQSINQIAEQWRKHLGIVPEALNIAIKEPIISPAGRAIYIRLQGDDLASLSQASHQMQNWLSGYPGVSNLMDDLRPGKPEFTINLKSGAFALGLTAQEIATQLRAAYQGIEVLETSIDLETYEVIVKLDDASKDELADFDYFPIIHPVSGHMIPLVNVAEIRSTRDFSRIQRINAQRAVTIYGDIDAEINNTQAIFQDLEDTFLTEFKQQHPDITIHFEGEIKEGPLTRNSMRKSMLVGLMGVFALLSLQFRSYSEPILVMANIPLAFIGVIFGHLIMGLDITMPSLLGFVSLAGIVVNDSILLVEFVKKHISEGMSPHQAAAKASSERFRAVVLTSLTTIVGLTPLLFEQSPQAQILIPLATSIVFGILSSTLLVLFVVPCLYTVLEDLGVVKIKFSQ
ncbi:MAG: efflux RND transporter permease subunit [Methylococcales bacterium]|nr:efflux RND transporter permease subunit [Methylococcales bacterium]